MRGRRGEAPGCFLRSFATTKFNRDSNLGARFEADTPERQWEGGEGRESWLSLKQGFTKCGLLGSPGTLLGIHDGKAMPIIMLRRYLPFWLGRYLHRWCKSTYGETTGASA